MGSEDEHADAERRSYLIAERRGYLKDEWVLAQNHYEDFDRRSLTIKGWIASGAVAGLAISFATSYRYVYFVPLIIAIITAVFWYLEAYWKLFQYAVGDRIRIIEAYFRGDPDIFIKDPAPFQIYHQWYLSYKCDEPLYEYEKTDHGRPHKKRSVRLRQVAFQPFVCLPYLVIIVLSLACFVGLLLYSGDEMGFLRVYDSWRPRFPTQP